MSNDIDFCVNSISIYSYFNLLYNGVSDRNKSVVGLFIISIANNSKILKIKLFLKNTKKCISFC